MPKQPIPVIRDRIRELRRVPARALQSHPSNWRIHAQPQRDALLGVLGEIGYADALLARECPDGSLQLIDGHLRAETTPDALVPVLIVDVNEEEATKLLLTLDPLAAMAQTDLQLLRELSEKTHFESAAVQTLLAEISRGPEELQPFRDPPPQPATEPLEVHQVIVNCRDESEQREVYDWCLQRKFSCRLVCL